MPTGYIYRHIRLDKNEPFYIGISLNNINYKRAYSNFHRNKIWKDIVNKTEYEVEILLDNLTKEEIFTKEKEFIKLYGRKNLGTGCLANMTDGGEGTLGSKHNLGKHHSNFTKLKISKNRKGKNLKNNTHLKKTVYRYDKFMNLVKTYSCCRDTLIDGFDPGTVNKCCNNIRKIHKNYIFKYTNK